jgi:hypothetical protein
MDTNRRQSYRRFLFQHEGHEEICGAKARRVVPPIQNPRRFLRGKGSTEQCDLCISFPCPTFLCPKWTGTFLQNSHCEGQKNPSELFLFLSFFSANRTEEKDQPANLRGAQPFASIRVDSRFESSVLRRSTVSGKRAAGLTGPVRRDGGDEAINRLQAATASNTWEAGRRSR